jgi:lysylphosphatidylglycerol synthase-like protein
VATSADRRPTAPAEPRHTHRALSAARGHLLRRAIKLLGWLIFGYLLLKLVPDFKHALRSLEQVDWQWVVGALALEVFSECGYVTSWRAVVDPEKLLGRDPRGVRISTHAAWAQLGGGIVVPGGSLASIGVGAWILRRFGMPGKTIAERQFNLSFLNTAVDALALVVFGVGLAIGIFPGASNLALTLLPAALAASGLGAALLMAAGATRYSQRVESGHPKLASAVASVADAVAATRRMVFHRDGASSLLGAVAYLGFDALVLWTAFVAIHARPVPGLAVVVMAYIIGALGGSIPLPAGLGAVGGMAGMLILYGVGRGPAVVAVLLYEAVGLLVPLIGGTVAYLFLRREFGPIRPAPDDGDDGAGHPVTAGTTGK